MTKVIYVDPEIEDQFRIIFTRLVVRHPALSELKILYNKATRESAGSPGCIIVWDISGIRCSGMDNIDVGVLKVPLVEVVPIHIQSVLEKGLIATLNSQENNVQDH